MSPVLRHYYCCYLSFAALLAAGTNAVFLEVMRHVVEDQRGVKSDVRRKAGLTLHDVFFTEVSKVGQVRVGANPPSARRS